MPELIQRPFNPDELQILESALSPTLIGWAIDNPHVRESRHDQRLIRDLAALHAHSRVGLVEGRLADFASAVARKYNVNGQYRELQYLSPKETAGIAAGQLAIAKLLTTWYGLERNDFARLPVQAFELASMGVAGLQEAVCTAPRALGITTFTARDVYLATIFEAEAAVEAQGPDALTPFMDFPEYPN